MFRVTTIISGALIAAVTVSPPGTRAASYSEFVSGDLPSNSAAPFALTLDSGDNLLLAESSATDYDMLRLVVPDGKTLDSIKVEFHDSSNRVFLGMQSGPVWTAGVGNEIYPAVLLGWTDFPIDLQQHVGEEILDDVGSGAGAQGFVPPLPSGSYTLLFQTSSSVIRFGLNFSVAAIGSALPGDFNGDQRINGADLTVWRNSFAIDGLADATGDGDSDGGDFLLWQRNLGAVGAAGATAAVPEPRQLLQAVVPLAALIAGTHRAARSFRPDSSASSKG
jgi:hypothetical protein